MTAGEETVRLWGVVPAAGLSRRMGTAKQLLSFKDTTMVGAVVRTVLAAGVDAVVVVTRSELQDHLGLSNDPRIAIAINDDAQSQMIDSIRIALARITSPGAGEHGARDGVLVVPADMPAISAAALRSCADAYRHTPDRIVIATYRGRRGHPIIFPVAMQSELDELDGGLNELPRRHSDRSCEHAVDDATILRDVDTMDDYDGITRPDGC